MKKLEKLTSFCEKIEQKDLDLIKGGRTYSFCDVSTCTDDYQDTRTDWYDEDGNFTRSSLAIYEACC